MTVLPPCLYCRSPMVPNDGKPPRGVRRHAGHGICQACAIRARRGQSPSRPDDHLPPLEFDDRPWVADALCAQTDGELWFPEVGQTTTTAVAICRRCPVQAPCLQYALDNDQTDGVYGGLTPKQRRKLKGRAA